MHILLRFLTNTDEGICVLITGAPVGGQWKKTHQKITANECQVSCAICVGYGTPAE